MTGCNKVGVKINNSTPCFPPTAPSAPATANAHADSPPPHNRNRTAPLMIFNAAYGVAINCRFTTDSTPASPNTPTKAISASVYCNSP